jgi:integrase
MLPEPKRRVRFLQEAEADRLIQALPEHLVPVVRFALATGCRMREILQLEWSRVDFARRVSWLDHGSTKNGDGRGIPLNRDAILALRSVQGLHNRWCFTYRGVRMEAVGSAWKRSLRRAGIEKVSIPRSQAYVGKLARDERDQSARAYGAWRLEVV